MGTPQALRQLGWLKLRGTVRRQLRKMRTWRGALFTLLGLGILVLWIGQLALSFLVRSERGDPETLPQRIGVGSLLLLVLTVSGALAHRGLFLPRDEIERLFSAPLSRSDLVRYRLRAAAVRSLMGGLIVGLVVAPRMPEPWFAFLGVLVGMQTLPVVQQLVAILLGGIEGRFGKRLALAGRMIWPLGFVLLLLLVMASLTGSEGGIASRLQSLIGGFLGEDADPFRHPTVVAVTRGFLPWARMIGATGFESFVLWLSVCCAILFALVEVTVRIPVDFRELSLETSANVAARIRRARRGGGVASSQVSQRAAGRSVPWFFGRGPGGAIAWRKTGAILRKARGTIVVSILLLAFVSALSFVFGEEGPPWAGAAMVAGFGTMYLCAGLRFDFRDELDRMDVIKAWPVGPTRLFLAMLLPETVLVSGLLVAAVLLRALAGGGLDVVTCGILVAVPLVVLAWVALDNAVFLFAPVRFVPGQEGALQNAGRGIVLLFLRMVVLLVVAALGALAFYLATVLAGEVLLFSQATTLIAGFAALLASLAAMVAGLVVVGGKVLERFDVARDR